MSDRIGKGENVPDLTPMQLIQQKFGAVQQVTDQDQLNALLPILKVDVTPIN